MFFTTLGVKPACSGKPVGQLFLSSSSFSPNLLASCSEEQESPWMENSLALRKCSRISLAFVSQLIFCFSSFHFSAAPLSDFSGVSPLEASLAGSSRFWVCSARPQSTLKRATSSTQTHAQKALKALFCVSFMFQPCLPFLPLFPSSSNTPQVLSTWSSLPLPNPPPKEWP